MAGLVVVSAVNATGRVTLLEVHAPVLAPSFSISAPARCAIASSRFAVVFPCLDMSGFLFTGVRAADEDRRRVAAIVLVAVAHAAAPVEQRVIEQVAVAVLRGLQLVEELAELHDLIGADLGVLGELLGVVAVVRDAVVRLRDADVGVAAVARPRGRS